jgi:dolichol-phosphate mannosyltransferase
VKHAAGTVSVVVPLLNEERTVHELVERLAGAAKRCDASIEFIVVDDGSTDETVALLRRELPKLARWKLVKLSRNFGQQAALRAGLEQASGDAIVFIDGDLQDPPEAIPELIRSWRTGARVVVACRRTRAEKGLRRLAFLTFHKAFAWLTNEAMPPDSGTFGLVDRVVADHMLRLPEVNLFLPAVRCWVGFSRAVVWYDRDSRVAGDAKSLTSLINYAWDGITSFSEKPLKAITLAGAALFVLTFAYAGALVAIRLLQTFGLFGNLRVQGFTTLAVGMLGLGGLQLFSIGILGEYVARIFRETKGRPLYLIEDIAVSDEPE